MLRKLDNLFRPIAVENLGLFLAVAVGLVSGAALFMHSPIGFVNSVTFIEGKYWNLFFFPFRMNFGVIGIWEIISLVFTVLLINFFGQILEHRLGTVRFSAFVYTGYLINVLGAFLFWYYMDPQYFYLTLFLATAIKEPEYEIHVNLIFPIKLKWLAYFAFGYVLYKTIMVSYLLGSIMPFLGPIFGLASLIIFFVPEMVSGWKNKFQRERRKKEFRNKMRGDD